MPEQRVNILIYRPDGTLIAQYLLGDGEHLIGRDINCPVYLDSEHISSNHAKLHLSAEGIYIEDLNSTSGTYLDGVTVRGKLRIKPGQVLQVGDLTVDLQPESVDNVGPGSRLGDGRYTLIRLLGRGGMGEVWLAKDEQLEEEVALKKIPHEVAADAMALADMRREVQKSRALTHQNIIRIHDLYVKPGEDPFISLEYVDGRDLTHITATKTNGIFPWEEIKPLVLQLCEALEYAHGQKIVHRDLKPANLMITRDSQLKLADFGIAATMVDSLSRSSIQGFVSGTTLYMSPQQMEGEAPQASDDIYAFGATLYELLTSRPPFYTGDVQHQVQEVIPKPMDQRLAEFGFTNEIPGYANQLVMACLAKEQERRPQGMAAIREWIESEGAAKEVIPKPSTKTVRRARSDGEPLEPELTPAKKGAKYAALAAVIAVVIGLGFWAKNQIEELDAGQQRVQGPRISKTQDDGNGSEPVVLPQDNRGGNLGSRIVSLPKPLIVRPRGKITVLRAPKDSPIHKPPAGNDFVDIQAGSNFALALKADGSVIAWGENDEGQLNVPAGLKGVKDITAADKWAFAVKSDGTLVGWGGGSGNKYGALSIPKGLENVAMVDSGGAHALAVTREGKVYGWGSSSMKQADPPESLIDVVFVEANNFSSYALKSDGAIVGWGVSRDLIKPPSGFQDFVSISTFKSIYDVVIYGVKRDGSLWKWGIKDLKPERISGVTNAQSVAVSGKQTYIVNRNGSLWKYDISVDVAQPASLGGIIKVDASGPIALALAQKAENETGFDPNEGLIAYYPLNGNARDASTNALHATVQQIVPLGIDRHGKADSAYYFDTIGNISCPRAIQNDTGNGGTISLWVKDLGKGGNPFVALSGGPSNRRYISIGSSRISFTIDKYSFSGDAPTDQWHHAVLTWRNNHSDAEVFVNGKSVGKTTSKYWLEPSVGISPSIGGGFGTGKLAVDDVRLYRRGFTGDEVKQLFEIERSKSPPTAPLSPEPATPESLKKGLTGYYPFNGNAKDESGNGNDGTLKEIVKFSNDRFGSSNSACIFDGELGYVAFPRGVAKDTQDTATVSLWFLMPAEGSVGHLFKTTGSVGSTQRGISIEKSGKINASIGYPSASLEGAVAENGKWHHACLIYRTKIDNAELYLDGQLVAKNKKKYWLEGLPDFHSIAAFNTRTKCTMDDMRFYNRDLSAAEVKKLYDLERKKP